MDGGCQELPNELKNTKNGLGSWRCGCPGWSVGIGPEVRAPGGSGCKHPVVADLGGNFGEKLNSVDFMVGTILAL